MTVVVGICCSDGVVVGADSAVTFGIGPQIRTIEQLAQKIDIVGNSVIVAGTGEIGLGQRFTAIVNQAWEEKIFEHLPITVGRALSKTAIDDFNLTHAKLGNFGALVAFPSKSGTQLCEFALHNFQPELKIPKRVWYVSIGSGQPIVDPFLGLIRRVFWEDEAPSYREAIFAVTWALTHAIDVNPGGIQGPISLAVLAQGKGGLHARLLDEDELSEHIDSVQGVEAHLRGYADKIGANADEAPDVPKPE